MRIGVVGTGHLGNIHLKCLKQTDFNCIGVFDIDSSRSARAATDHGIKNFPSFQEMLEEIDAVIIVSDTSSHYELAKAAVSASKHVFIEKPVTANLDQAFDLKTHINAHSGIKVQIGHVERYNPAFVSALTQLSDPKFIECHRLANFNPRGNDVSVILDLMIHDLDILLTVVKSEVAEIRANGVSIVSKTPDICNARIEFVNGCVANITASRLSLNQMRKFRIFQSDAYIGIDFLAKSNQIIQLKDEEQAESMKIETDLGTKYLNIKSQPAQEINAIVEEQKDFYNSIVQDKIPTVNIDHAVRVMKLANDIEKQLNKTHE